jgi:ribonuclease HII
VDLHAIEGELHRRGFVHVAGIDEAGRGPLAGPVCAAAVVFPPGTRIGGVNDSKQVPPAVRERLEGEIRDLAISVGVGLADAAEIDRINILQATKMAVRRAVRNLTVLPDFLLLDALRIEDLTIPQEALVKGDARCFSIAAASIVAKVTRDRLMVRYDAEYPGYGFAGHKGYGSEVHRRSIAHLGLSTIHRRSFCNFGFLPPVLEPGFHWPVDGSGAPVCSATFQRLQHQIREARDVESLRGIAAEGESLRGFLPACEIAWIRGALNGASGRLQGRR